MKFLQRFDEINPKVVYLLMAIALTLPVIKPIGMPITINKDMTMPVYNWIESLQPGDVVIFDTAYSGGSDAELTPQLKAWFYHCMKKGVKAIGVSQWEPGGPMAWPALNQVAEQCKAEGISAVYGVDWVYVGYKSGGTNTWRAMQTDFWKACGNVDYMRNDFSTLPLMQKVRKWDKESVKGIMIFSAGDPGIGTYTTLYPDHNIYVGNVAVQVATASNLLRSGQIKGILAGLRGAAEYEKLIGKPGYATRLMDAQSAGHLIIIVLVILGNISFILKGGSKKKIKA